MSQDLTLMPLTAAAFSPYGDVLELGERYKMINDDQCERHHDLARLDFGAEIEKGRAGVSLFNAQGRTLPYAFDLIERHPEGSQAFIPMHQQPFMVIVSDGPDAQPKVFKTNGRQGINFHRGTWHGVLTPLYEAGLFAVVDRIGPTANIEIHRFTSPWIVTR